MLFFLAVIAIVFFIGGWKYESMKSSEQQAEDWEKVKAEMTGIAIGSAAAICDIIRDGKK